MPQRHGPPTVPVAGGSSATRGLHLLVVMLLALGAVLALPVTAYAADPTASISIQKSVNTSTVVPGQTFDYTIQVQCTSGAVAGCVNAEVTDELPEYVSLNGTVTVAGSTDNPTVDDGPPIVVTFNDDLGGGAVGLAPGNVIDITIPVKIDDDIPPEASGQDLVNTATITADNASEKSDDATVTPDVETTLDAETTKVFSSDGDPAVPGTPLTVALTGENTSNVPVETLVITDPPATGATANPFTYIGIVDPPADVTMPDGADTVQVSLYVDGAWVDGPAGPPQPTYPADVDPADATGIRWTFASTDGADIPPGEAAEVGINLEQRDNVADLSEATTVTNVADTTVSNGTDDATSEPASDTYRIRPVAIDVIAGKTFDPDTVTAGDPSTVILTGTNNSEDPLTTMTITEPAAGTPNHFADGGFTYTASENDVDFPTGATAGTVTFACDGAPADPQPLSDGSPLPDPPAGCDPVTGFSVTFTGSIEPGAEATVPFVVTTDEDQTQDELTRLNVVQVDGSNGQASATNRATDLITSYIKRLDVETTKKIVPSTIPAWPGEIVTAELSGRVLPFPDSTVPATQIIVQDPSSIPDPNQWYDSFDPAGVVATPVPACATGSVNYTVDGTTWLPVPGMQDVPPGIYNQPFPPNVQEDAIGIQFVYTADPAGGSCSGGFAPGTSVAPNISYSLEDDVPNEAATFTDCAATSATTSTPPLDATSPQACDAVDVTAYDGAGVDAIDKSWDKDLLNARSQEQSGATISWSTGGFTGIGRVQITDPNDFDQALPDSVFDTFDLVRIDPITAALDPLLTYDQIIDVRLFRLPAGSTAPTDGTWQDATNDPCPAACDGTFPGYTLTAEERATTIAFQLDYIESPTREDRLSAGAPPVGSGVAASTGNNRHLHPVFQLRDELRSDPDVPITADRLYNTATQGEILNSVQLDPFRRIVDRDPIQRFTADDTIELVDVPVTADATKSWTGGPLGIPDPDVPQDQWPTARVTITGTNTTPAKVDELVIADPTAGTTPFDAFNLVRFVSITPPADIGATEVTVHLTPGPGGKTDYTRDEALALTEADLVDVTGFSFDYTGRINAGSHDPIPTATIVFDTRLRTESRSAGQPPQPGTTVTNATTTTVSDLVDYPDVTPNSQTANAADDIDLVAQGLDVVAGKSFSPDTLTEPDDGPVTATLSGQPVAPGDGGPLPPSRAVKLVLTDTSATFWNAYDLVQLNPITFVAPVDQVQVDAYVGGTWSVNGSGDPVLTGGDWVTGTATTDSNVTLPGGVTADQVQGLRHTFTRADGANWENPANPVQTATFQVQRRDTLNTGGPVLPDLAQNDPAPGETAPGVTTNLVTAEVTSSDVDGNGDPLTATDDDDATITYHHATNAVTVTKVGNSNAGSSVAPGADFPYTLTVTNSGDVDIVNPVITDRLPTDADGPQVVVADDPRLAYEITGGTGMPTDPDAITVTVTPDLATATEIRWQFPDGSTLPIGASYTITFYVHTRPGLAADTDFTNEFGVTGDRPWDDCTNGGSDAVEQNGECATDTTNTVQSAGAVSVRKQVRAEGSDTLGVVIDPLATLRPACQADADGFYSRPCIPIAEPGGDITWRWHFTNSGNRPLDRILGIDRLPTATGDQIATAPLDRGSQWKPVLTGARPTLANGDGTLAIYYTTSTTGWCDGPEGHDDYQLCDADDPNVSGGAGLDWEEWPAGQTLADLDVDPDDVTGLASDFLPTSGGDPDDLAPAATFDVDVPMVAPAFSPADTPNTTGLSAQNTYAFNTVGTSARVDSTVGRAAAAADIGTLDAGDPYTLTTEPPRVGVGLAHGGFTLVKRVDGDGAQHSPDTFNVTVSCTSVGEDVPLPADVANQTVSADTPVRVYDLPYHARCTLADGAGNGQTSSNAPQTVTVQQNEADFETATLINTYDSASLSIAKEVIDSAVDADGNSIAYGPFSFTVECTFLGEPVEAIEPMTFELSSDSDPVVLTGLPAGAECTATESDTGGAGSTTSEGTTGAGSDDEERSTGGTSIDLVLAPDGEDPVVTNTVVFTNTFPTGRVVITKEITGSAADLYQVGPFTVHLTCVDASDPTRTVYDADHQLTTDDLTWTVTDLYVDSTCEVTEPATGGATTSVVSPQEPFPVTADSNESPVQVSVVNTFDVGGLRLIKKLDDPDARVDDDTSFTFEVACRILVDGEIQDITLPDGGVVELTKASGLTATYDDLPVGAVCTVTETATGGADDSVVQPGQVTIGDATTVDVIATNTFDPLPPDHGGSSGGDSDLASTGGPSLIFFGIGVLLLIVGGTLLLARRRSD